MSPITVSAESLRPTDSSISSNVQLRSPRCCVKTCVATRPSACSTSEPGRGRRCWPLKPLGFVMPRWSPSSPALRCAPSRSCGRERDSRSWPGPTTPSSRAKSASPGRSTSSSCRHASRTVGAAASHVGTPWTSRSVRVPCSPRVVLCLVSNRRPKRSSRGPREPDFGRPTTPSRRAPSGRPQKGSPHGVRARCLRSCDLAWNDARTLMTNSHASLDYPG